MARGHVDDVAVLRGVAPRERACVRVSVYARGDDVAHHVVVARQPRHLLQLGMRDGV